jgi:hypothetical protein
MSIVNLYNGIQNYWDSFMKTATAHCQSFFTDTKRASIDSFQPQADIWVKLRDRPNDYSDDEALLMCEMTSGVWLGWVPGFGQITLLPGSFYRRM